MITEFDENYFDGETEAGMNGYHRSPINDPSIPLNHADDFGLTHWALFQKHRNLFDNKTVLFVGCAKGFDVEDFRQLGVDAYGIDISSYAISKSNPEIRPHLAVDSIENLSVEDLIQYDTIVGLRVLPCMTDENLQSFSNKISLSGCESIFLVDTLEIYSPSELLICQQNYNVKTLNEWKSIFPGSFIYQFNKFGNNF